MDNPILVDNSQLKIVGAVPAEIEVDIYDIGADY
jgi:hypothetical protein